MGSVEFSICLARLGFPDSMSKEYNPFPMAIQYKSASSGSATACRISSFALAGISIGVKTVSFWESKKYKLLPVSLNKALLVLFLSGNTFSSTASSREKSKEVSSVASSSWPLMTKNRHSLSMPPKPIQEALWLVGLAFTVFQLWQRSKVCFTLFPSMPMNISSVLKGLIEA